MRWLSLVLIGVLVLGIASAKPMGEQWGKHPLDQSPKMGKSKEIPNEKEMDYSPAAKQFGKPEMDERDRTCTHNQTHLRLQNRTCSETYCRICNETCVCLENRTQLRLHNETKAVQHGKGMGVERRIEKKIVERRIEEFKMKHEMAKMRMKMQKAKQAVENAKMRYERAKEVYMRLRGHGLNDPKTFRYAKQFVCAGVDYVERWLERLRVMVQNANMGEDQKERLMVRIQNCLMALNESKNAVNASTTPEELKSAVAELERTWNDARIVIRSVVGQIAVAELKLVVDKTEDLTLKLEAEIEALNASGVDVTKLNDLLEECKWKLNEAKERLDEANQKFEEMLNATNPNELYVEGRHLLKEARELIRGAFTDIKRIYYEIMHLKVGKLFFGNETGELLVVGSGSFDVHFTGLTVMEVDGNVTVSPSVSVVKVIGLTTTESNGTLSASGHGRLIVRGENVTLNVQGFVRMFVKGEGTATLSGEGIYKLKKSPKEKMIEDTFGNVTLEFGVVE